LRVFFQHLEVRENEAERDDRADRRETLEHSLHAVTLGGGIRQP
jgi:hypothetical protein